MTPVTIISGFLGAGKTTLLNRMLRESPEKLGLLVNDFAELNVDIDLVESADENKISLSNGCVCCTIRDDLIAAALQLVQATPRPDRIVIETSGVSDPVSVAEAFLSPFVADRLNVESAICLIDAENFLDLDFISGELAIDQAAVADIVLLNKCDLVAPEVVNKVEETLLAALPKMRILRTRHAKAPWAVLAGPNDRDLDLSRLIDETPCEHAGNEHVLGHCDCISDEEGGRQIGKSHVHDHTKDYESLSWRGHISSVKAFQDVVKRLPSSVLRAKGMLRFPGPPAQRGVFQQVGKRASLDLYPVETAQGDISSLVFIARIDQLAQKELSRLLDEFVSEAAINHN